MGVMLSQRYEELDPNTEFELLRAQCMLFQTDSS